MMKEESNNKSSTKKPEEKVLGNSFWHIDKDMLPFKALYVFFYGATGCVLPFAVVVARNRIGLSATALASVLTTQELITCVSRPIIGYIADYFNRIKTIISILILFLTVFWFALLAIPPIGTTSASVLNELEDIEQNTESLKLNIQHCKNNQNKSSSLYINRHTVMHINETICGSEINATKTFCGTMLLTDETQKSDFQINSTYCCELKTTKLHFFNYISKNDSIHFFYLRFSNKSNIFSQKENDSFHCAYNHFEDDVSNMSSVSIKSQFATLEFWMFAVIYTMGGLCFNSLTTLIDTACLECVEKYNSDFGRQRIYCAVGWGVFAPLAGLLCDVSDDFYYSWCLMLILLIISLSIIFKLDLLKPHFSQNILKDVGTVLKSAEFAAFEFGVFMNGFGNGVVWFYLIWFLNTLGGSKFLLGLLQNVQCFAGEIPFMFFSGWIIKKLGHLNVLTVSLLCFGIRFLWYSNLHDPWHVFPVEVLHGITYGVVIPAAVSYGKLHAKPGTEATTQSIISTTYDGLGGGVGCIVGGLGFDYFGSHRTFFYISLFSFSGLVINLVNTIFLRRPRKIFTVTTKKSET